MRKEMIHFTCRKCIALIKVSDRAARKIGQAMATKKTRMKSETRSDEPDLQVRPKGKYPVTRAQFRAKAKPLSIQIGDNKDIAEPLVFSSGALGFYSGGQVVIEIDGVPCKCRVTCSVVLVHSKDLE